ncbi:iron complex transport system ATP-binding protein [Neorhizobium sp. 2083]|uniref:ABC transporter ATP-binding protein n=1 Tax=Neorhizobium sp. 2083 TaxID=2817762 RepID=UPI00285C94AB|nr:ATP-binding cassette domain-containing protein [Neorhizobium sp. 2083]MDR6820357.1 iron complex transport system ATP-binding protein [Neorhizobium sp. 2083]
MTDTCASAPTLNFQTVTGGDVTSEQLAQNAPETTKVFEIDRIGLSIDGNAILSDVSLEFPAGEVVALVGHNGSGKSSLLKILARQLTPTSGTAAYGGRDLKQYQARDFARSVAYLPQDLNTGSDMTIRELVGCGRYPWHGALGRFSEIDKQKVEAAIAATHIETFAERVVGTLSGGERQRAWIAMLIAQDAHCLLLDEPTGALDIAHQVEVLSLVRRLAHEGGRSVVIVLHDINMAARFCDRIHALKGGRVVASGTPGEILVPATLHAIYGIVMDVISVPTLSHPLAYAC